MIASQWALMLFFINKNHHSGIVNPRAKEELLERHDLETEFQDCFERGSLIIGMMYRSFCA
jgi:hypothetical protein